MSSGDNISQIKLGRVTQQSIHLLRHLKQFFNLQFKIQECEDDVYSDESEDDDQKEADSEIADAAQVIFPKAFIFTCIGIGLTNFARKAE